MKVTDDLKYMTCSRLPSLMGVGHPAAPSKNELLQEFIDKKNGAWVEPEQNNYSKYTDYFEEMLQKISKKHFPKLQFKKGANLKPYTDVHSPLGASIDDWAVAKEPIQITDPLGETFDLVGDILWEYKVTSISQDELPLYRGPVQVQGQMMCTLTTKAVVMVFNTKTWEIQYWPILENKETQSLIRNAVREFWNRREKELYYDPEKSSDYSLVYPEALDKTVDLSGNNHIGDAINTWHEGNLEIKSGKKKIEASQDIIKGAMGEAAFGKYNDFAISWPVRNYKAKPEKVVPAQEAYSKRSNTISIKENNEKKESN